MIALTIVAIVVVIVGYVALAVKIGLLVGDWADKTRFGAGFGAGFYMMTTAGLLAIPFAVWAQVSQ